MGPVGCGKSTLLKGLLGEVPYTRGSITMPSRSIAFCDQTPWVVNGTVNDNITLFSSANEDYYQSVLAACSLHDDLGQLPNGDRSNVGSKGITLSGGQKQRVVCGTTDSRPPYSDYSMTLLDLTARFSPSLAHCSLDGTLIYLMIS